MKTVTISKEKNYCENDLVQWKKIVKRLEKYEKEPGFRKAVKEFYRFHTGKSLRY